MKFLNKVFWAAAISFILIISIVSCSIAEETGNETSYFTELTTLIGEVMFYNYSFLSPISTSFQQKGIDSQNAVLLLSSILASNSSLQKRWKKLVPSDNTKSNDSINKIFSLTENCVKRLIDYINNSTIINLDKYQKFYVSLDTEMSKLLKEK